MKKILCILLTLCLMLGMLSGCAGNMDEPDALTAVAKEGKTYGEGSVSFTFVITDEAGKSTTVTVKTDKETVGEALLDTGLVYGENGPYGLYIKEVSGIVADYDVNQAWWGFWINGESAMTGVDGEKVTPGATYELRFSK